MLDPPPKPKTSSPNHATHAKALEPAIAMVSSRVFWAHTQQNQLAINILAPMDAIASMQTRPMSEIHIDPTVNKQSEIDPTAAHMMRGGCFAEAILSCKRLAIK